MKPQQIRDSVKNSFARIERQISKVREAQMRFLNLEGQRKLLLAQSLFRSNHLKRSDNLRKFNVRLKRAKTEFQRQQVQFEAMIKNFDSFIRALREKS